MGSIHHEPPDLVARDRLRSFVERAERLNAEIKGLNDDKALVFAEAKASGFDVKIIKTVIKRRKLDAGERDEQDELLAMYEHALEEKGESSHAHVHARETPPDDPPAPRGGEINGPQLVALDCLIEQGAYVRSDNAGTVVDVGFPTDSGTGNGILLNAAEWSELVGLGLVERTAEGGPWQLTRKGFRWRAELRRGGASLAAVAEDEGPTDDPLPDAAGDPPPEPAPTRPEQDAADSMAAYERVQAENGHDTRSAGEHLAEDRPHPDDLPEEPPDDPPAPADEIRAVTIWSNEKLRTRLDELRRARNLSADRSPEVLADYDAQIALVENEIRGRGHTVSAAPATEDLGAEIDPRTVDEAAYADMPPPERKAFRDRAEVIRHGKGKKSYAAIEVIEAAPGWVWNVELEFGDAPGLPNRRGPFPRSAFGKAQPSREAAIAAAAKEIEESLHPVVDKKSSPASAAQRKEASNIILWAAGLRSMYGRADAGAELREAAGNKPAAAGVFL